MSNVLTDVTVFGDWCVKREDLAFFTDPKYPSGSKVRQYMTMSKSQPGAPMMVGCSANSAMQIYVAAAAHQTGVPAIIYTAARKEKTAATLYAEGLGAQIEYVRPGHLSVIRARAKAHGMKLGNVVRWNVGLAIMDAAAQCQNIPDWCERVIVATGSGLIASGVLAGLAQREKPPVVVAVSVSGMARQDKIIANAKRAAGPMVRLPKFEFHGAILNYDEYIVSSLPDGTPLDPFYAAKAMPLVREGDCLWTPGLRPVSAMPIECQEAFGGWVSKMSGFKRGRVRLE